MMWEESGGQGLLIGANRLTNRQLYWVAVARKYYAKYQSIVPEDFLPFNRLQNEYLHVWLKNKKGFQEAFECQMTQEEQEKLREFSERWKSLKLSQVNSMMNSRTLNQLDIEPVAFVHRHICETLVPW